LLWTKESAARHNRGEIMPLLPSTSTEAASTEAASTEAAVQSAIMALRQQCAADFSKCEQMSDRIKRFSAQREQAALTVQQQLSDAQSTLDKMLGETGKSTTALQTAAIIDEKHRLQERAKLAEEARREAVAAHESLATMVANMGEARQAVAAMNDALEHEPAKQKAYFHLPATRASLNQPPLVCTTAAR
jgi:hypothetical protein